MNPNEHPRWQTILDTYLAIRDEGASSEERRNRPTVCLADACQRIAELEAEVERLKGLGQATIDALHIEHERECCALIDERDRVEDAIQDAHIALGGNGEWVAHAGQVCAAGETGDLCVDVPVLAGSLRDEQKQMNDALRKLKAQRDELLEALRDIEEVACASGTLLGVRIQEIALAAIAKVDTDE